MKAAYRVNAVRAAEQQLMATLPPGTLMFRAAAGLARRCAITLSSVYAAKVVLLVGSGDNGGDALYAGAILAGQGAAVTAVLAAPERAHAAGLKALLQAGGRVGTEFPSTVDLIVDGLVGIGVSGPLRGQALELVRQIPQGVPVIAVDLPSGVDADTGEVLGEAVRADVTVTFGCLKPGLLVGPAVPNAGQVELVDIGLEPKGTPALQIADAQDVAAWWPTPTEASDKYTRGVVGLATGSDSYPGAALLSVAGALAGPTGMVRYAGSVQERVSTAYPPVVVTGRVADAMRVQAWVCGCGLGTDERAQTELRTVLAAAVPVVLDADALTMLVDGSMAGALRERDAPTVLTPHDREFARLAGGDPGPDRVAAALRLASWTRSVVLLKGYRTIVATPAGEAWVNMTGSPALATGGTGDVLAGLLGSLLAAGLSPVRAAVAASYVHGLAGRHAATGGPVTATHVAQALRPVLADVHAGQLTRSALVIQELPIKTRDR